MVVSSRVDAGDLDPADALELEELVARCGLRDLAGKLSAGPGGPDRYTYRITLEEQGRTHEVAINEEGLNEAIRSLVSFIEDSPSATRGTGPPGTDT